MPFQVSLSPITQPVTPDLSVWSNFLNQAVKDHVQNEQYISQIKQYADNTTAGTGSIEEKQLQKDVLSEYNNKIKTYVDSNHNELAFAGSFSRKLATDLQSDSRISTLNELSTFAKESYDKIFNNVNQTIKNPDGTTTTIKGKNNDDDYTRNEKMLHYQSMINNPLIKDENGNYHSNVHYSDLAEKPDALKLIKDFYGDKLPANITNVLGQVVETMSAGNDINKIWQSGKEEKVTVEQAYSAAKTVLNSNQQWQSYKAEKIRLFNLDIDKDGKVVNKQFDPKYFTTNIENINSMVDKLNLTPEYIKAIQSNPDTKDYTESQIRENLKKTEIDKFNLSVQLKSLDYRQLYGKEAKDDIGNYSSDFMKYYANDSYSNELEKPILDASAHKYARDDFDTKEIALHFDNSDKVSKEIAKKTKEDLGDVNVFQNNAIYTENAISRINNNLKTNTDLKGIAWKNLSDGIISLSNDERKPFIVNVPDADGNIVATQISQSNMDELAGFIDLDAVKNIKDETKRSKITKAILDYKAAKTNEDNTILQLKDLAKQVGYDFKQVYDKTNNDVKEFTKNSPNSVLTKLKESFPLSDISNEDSQKIIKYAINGNSEQSILQDKELYSNLISKDNLHSLGNKVIFDKHKLNYAIEKAKQYEKEIKVSKTQTANTSFGKQAFQRNLKDAISKIESLAKEKGINNITTPSQLIYEFKTGEGAKLMDNYISAFQNGVIPSSIIDEDGKAIDFTKVLPLMTDDKGHIDKSKGNLRFILDKRNGLSLLMTVNENKDKLWSAEHNYTLSLDGFNSNTVLAAYKYMFADALENRPDNTANGTVDIIKADALKRTSDLHISSDIENINSQASLSEIDNTINSLKLGESRIVSFDKDGTSKFKIIKEKYGITVNYIDKNNKPINIVPTRVFATFGESLPEIFDMFNANTQAGKPMSNATLNTIFTQYNTLVNINATLNKK